MHPPNGPLPSPFTERWFFGGGGGNNPTKSDWDARRLAVGVEIGLLGFLGREDNILTYKGIT